MKLSDTLFLSIITVIVLSTLGGYKLLTSHVSLAPYKEYFVKQTQTTSSTQIKATFLGTSSLLITDGKTTLLTDGFITRPSIATLLLSKIQPNKQKIDAVLDRLNIKKIDAVMTLHSHHDHALDSAYVATKTQAVLIGSNSTANIARGSAFKEENLKVITNKEEFRFGKFKITILPSSHSKLPSLLEKVVGVNENINKPLKLPSYFTNFKEGGTYSVYIEHPLGNIFINASTGFIQNQLNDYDADVVFLGIAGLGKRESDFQENYFHEIVDNLKAKRVLPIHWDDFTQNINEPTQAMNKLFDDFDGSMKFLIPETKKRNIQLEMMNIFDEVVLY